MDTAQLRSYFNGDFLNTLFRTRQPIAEELLSVIVENFILTNLSKEHRLQFYTLLENQTNISAVDKFLKNSIPNFDHKLNLRIKDEISILMKPHEQ